MSESKPISKLGWQIFKRSIHEPSLLPEVVARLELAMFALRGCVEFNNYCPACGYELPAHTERCAVKLALEGWE